LSYTSCWTMYNQVYMMNNKVPRWREASSSTPHGQRIFYFRDLVDCAWYLLRRSPDKAHMVYCLAWTIHAQGDCVYSEMNSADCGWKTQD
jgi:hypothetical protein